MANFIITEEQYKRLMKEDALNSPSTTSDSSQKKPTIEINNTTGDAGEAVTAAQKTLGGADVKLSVPNKQSNANSGNATSVMSMNNSVGESRIITKKELTENRFKYLKENSKLYTVQDFLRK